MPSSAALLAIVLVIVVGADVRDTVGTEDVHEPLRDCCLAGSTVADDSENDWALSVHGTTSGCEAHINSLRRAPRTPHQITSDHIPSRHPDTSSLTLPHSSIASRSSGHVRATSSSVLPAATASVATRLARRRAAASGVAVGAAAEEPEGVVAVDGIQVRDVQDVDPARGHRPGPLEPGEVLVEIHPARSCPCPAWAGSGRHSASRCRRGRSPGRSSPRWTVGRLPGACRS